MKWLHFNILIKNCIKSWQIFWYQLRWIYYGFHSCLNSLVPSPFQGFSLFEVLQAEKKSSRKKIQKMPHRDERQNLALHKKWIFPLRISSINAAKSEVFCISTSFFVWCRANKMRACSIKFCTFFYERNIFWVYGMCHMYWFLYTIYLSIYLSICDCIFVCLR